MNHNQHELGRRGQTTGSLRNIWDSQPSRSRTAHLFRALRPPASRTGECRYCCFARQPGHGPQRHGACSRGVRKQSSRKVERPHRHWPRALFHHRQFNSRQRTTLRRASPQQILRARSQRKSGQRVHPQKRTRRVRVDFPDDHGYRDFPAPVC